MQIIISNTSDQAIYEQISSQIKDNILNGNIISGEALPSIRVLAKDLRVSVITTKKAYEKLEQENYIEVIPGKGSYVKNKSDQILKEEVIKKIENELNNVIELANKFSLSKKEITDILNCLYEEENNE